MDKPRLPRRLGDAAVGGRRDLAPHCDRVEEKLGDLRPARSTDDDGGPCEGGETVPAPDQVARHSNRVGGLVGERSVSDGGVDDPAAPRQPSIPHEPHPGELEEAAALAVGLGEPVFERHPEIVFRSTEVRPSAGGIRRPSDLGRESGGSSIMELPDAKQPHFESELTAFVPRLVARDTHAALVVPENQGMGEEPR